MTAVDAPEHKPVLIDGYGASFYTVCSCGEPPAENELAAALIITAFNEVIGKYRPQISHELELAMDRAQSYLIGRLAYVGDKSPDQYVVADNAAMIGCNCDDDHPTSSAEVDDVLRHPSGEGPLADSVRALRKYRAGLACAGVAQ